MRGDRGARWCGGRGAVSHRQGSEYTGNLFVEACRSAGITESMGRTGSALDNAVSEAFNSTVEFELLRRCHFTTREQARRAVATWIDEYNTDRRAYRTAAARCTARQSAPMGGGRTIHPIIGAVHQLADRRHTSRPSVDVRFHTLSSGRRGKHCFQVRLRAGSNNTSADNRIGAWTTASTSNTKLRQEERQARGVPAPPNGSVTARR